MWLDFKKSNIIGCELVENGDFSLGDNGDWSFINEAAGSSISGDKGNIVTSSDITGFSQTVLEVGKLYILTFDIVANNGGSIKLGSTSTGLDIVDKITDVDSYEYKFISAGTVLSFARWSGATNVSISNVVLKEVAQFVPDESNNCNEAKLFTGKALSFDGINDYVENSSMLTASKNASTLSFSIKNTGSSGGEGFIGNSTTNQFYLSISSNNLILRASRTMVFSYSFSLNTWYRISIVRFDDSGTSKTSIYVDDVLTSTIVNEFDFQFNRFGESTSGSYGQVLLSDIQLYNTAWTSDDVAYDYANPNNLAIDNPNATITKSNLIGYWALSEGSGNIAFDSAGLGGELITNGDFATDIIGWGNSLISVVPRLSWSNGKAKIENTTGTAVNTGINSTNDPFRDLSGTVVVTGNIQIIGGTAGAWGVREHYGDVASFTLEANGDFKANLSLDGTSDDLAIYTYASNVIFEVDNISARQVTDNDGTIVIPTSGDLVGATWVDQQPTIPQLGMMDWSKGSNLITFSEDFNANYWSKSNVVITPSAATSPLGGMSASLLVGDLISNTTYTRANAVAGTVRGKAYTLSLYVKAVGSSKILKYWARNTDAGQVLFDLVNVTTNNPSTSTITSVGGGWYKVTSTGVSNSASAVAPYFYPYYSANESRGFYIWGAQLEESSTAGSYIATAGLAAINATLIQNPNNIGYDVLGNSLRLREGGFNLDGSGYAEVANDSTLDFGTGDFSIECWVKYKFENTGSGLNVIMSNGSASSASTLGYNLLTNSSDFIIRLGNGTDVYTRTISGTPIVDTWYYIAFTRVGTELVVYVDDIDGVAYTDADIAVNVTTTNPILIGRDIQSNRYYKGLIDEPRIYNRALTQKEILNNYKIGLPKHS
jgi:hypothetical protein